MKINRILVALLAGFCFQSSHAALVDLTGLSYVTYGDGNSYSLAVGNYYACGSEMGKDCPYSVKGSPGAEEQDPRIYIVQGAGGHMDNGSASIDDAFAAVNNELYFTMTSANEPTPTFSGDEIGTWDATIGALHTSLDLLTNYMTFFFVNNEPNSQGAETQNLAVWARITLTSLDGLTQYGLWDLTNDTRTAVERLNPVTNPPPGYGPPPIGGGVFMGDVTDYTSEGNAPEITDFLMSGGQVCLNKTTKVPVDCSTATPGTFDVINHNLGENQAPYAVVAPELDAYIRSLVLDPSKNLNEYVLHVDLRYGCVTPPFSIDPQGKDECVAGTAISQDNNFEQVFISTRLVPNDVPEPTVLLLIGTGLMGLGLARKQRIV